MRFGVHIPLLGELSDPSAAAELAVLAETSGWDGFFTWDHIAPPWHSHSGDATVTLAAVAANTSRLRLGPMVTPLPRRRPAKFARETAALDLLSGGRLTLGVGIGGFKKEFGDLGDEADRKTRGRMLDEALELLSRLWSGEPVTHEGTYYTARDQQFRPRPVQRPRIPVWVAAHAGIEAPILRAARWDGIFPTLGNVTDDEAIAELERIRAVIAARRETMTGFDIVRGGETRPGAHDTALLSRYEAAGVTWWLENINPSRWGGWDPWPATAIRERIAAGPPQMNP